MRKWFVQCFVTVSNDRNAEQQKGYMFVLYLRIPSCRKYWWWTVSERKTRAFAADTVRVFCILFVWAEVVKRQTIGWRPRFPSWALRTGRAGSWPQTLSPRLGSGSRKSPAAGKPWRPGGETGEEREGVRCARCQGREEKEKKQERRWLGTWPSYEKSRGWIIMCFHLIPAVVPHFKRPTKDCCVTELDISFVSPARIFSSVCTWTVVFASLGLPRMQI